MTAGERKSVQIGDCTYSLRHAPATVSLRAAAIIANGFAPLLDGFRRGKGDVGDRMLAGVAETLADPALSKNLEMLCAAFAPYTDVLFADGRSQPLARLDDSSSGVFEVHFAGKIEVLLQWLQASVEYNLGGFLDEAKRKLADAKVPVPGSPSPSPKAAAASG